MRNIDRLLSEYGESHQNRINKAIHWLCVPVIFFSLVGLIWSVPAGLLQDNVAASPYANWASVSLVLVLAYYISLSLPLAIGMALFSLSCLVGTHALEQAQIAPLWQVCLCFFAAAVAGQFYGHKIEGKKPSFFKDVRFLLIGPAWLMHFILKRAGIRY